MKAPPVGKIFQTDKIAKNSQKFRTIFASKNRKFLTDFKNINQSYEIAQKFSNFQFEFSRLERLRDSNRRTVGADAICRTQRATKGAKSEKSFYSCKYAKGFKCVISGPDAILGPPLTSGRWFGSSQT